MAAAVLSWCAKPLARWRVGRLNRLSHACYAQKRYDESLAAAVSACELARAQLGDESAAHARALLHLAGVYAAMRRHNEAAQTLAQCEELACRRHGDDALEHVPICHAKAEVFETAGKYAEATAALERVRELRLEALGRRHISCAWSAFNLAGLVVRRANDTIIMSARQRAELADRAVDLAIDAAAAADAAGEREQGDEFAQAILDTILTGGWPNRLAQQRACAESAARLQQWLDARGVAGTS